MSGKKSLQMKLSGLLALLGLSFGVSFAGFAQVESQQLHEAWVALAKLIGGGVIGILVIIAITRLIQALKNQPLDGHRVTSELTAVLQKLDIAITLLVTTTKSDHDRMLKHDEELFHRLETMNLSTQAALNNHIRMIQHLESVTKQLDRIEGKK